MDDKNKIIKSFLSKAKKSNEEITTSLPKINNKGSIDSLEMDNIIMKTASKDLSESNRNKKQLLLRTKLLNLKEDVEKGTRSNYLKLISNYGKKLAISAESISLEEEDDEKRNIIHRACFQLKYEILKSIKNRISVGLINKLDIYGNSPLILASKNQTKDSKVRAQIIEMLIQVGADIHIIEPINGWTAIHWLCYNGDLNSIKILMKRGAIIFQPAFDGWFPIDLAGNRQHFPVVKYLVENNAHFLEKIGEYELLDPDYYNFVDNQKGAEVILGIIKGTVDKISRNNTQINHVNEIKNDNDEIDLYVELTKFPPFVQTVYLRLYTEHCLFWASYFDLSGKLINQYLLVFHANPTTEMFSQKEKNAIHAACIAGSVTSFQLIMNRYLALYDEYDPTKKDRVIMIFGDENHYVRNIVYPSEYYKFKSSLWKNDHFSQLEVEFQNYIIKNLLFIIYPRTSRHIKPLINLQDDNGDIPFNLAAKYSKFDFLKQITSNSRKYIQNVDSSLSYTNKEGLSGYFYLKDNDIQEEFLISAGKKIYPIPPVVLELNKNQSTKSSINLIMKIGLSENLKVNLMEHYNPNKVYLCVDINEKEFCIAAEQEKIEMRLLDKYLKLPFINKQEFIDSVEPFLTRQYQFIIFKILYNLIDTDMLKNQKIINSMFLTHKPNVTQKIYNTIIHQHFWWPNPICFIGNYFFEGKEIIYKPNNLLWRYFGESIAMYYTFYAYFTIMYFFIGLIGLIYTFIYRDTIFLSDHLYPTFFLCFTVWHFIFMYKWRRKCSEIELKWGMRMSVSRQEVRPEFNGDEYYRDLDSRLEKHVKRYSSVYAFLLLLPIILILLIGDIIVFYYTTKWEDKTSTHSNFLYRYIPSIVRSIALTIVSYIYDYYAWWSNYKENYKHKHVFENVLIIKIFAFRLVSDLTAVIYNILVTKQIDRVKTLLYSNIIVKYLTEIGLKFFYPIGLHLIRRKYYFRKVSESKKIGIQRKVNLITPKIENILESGYDFNYGNNMEPPKENGIKEEKENEESEENEEKKFNEIKTDRKKKKNEEMLKLKNKKNSKIKIDNDIDKNNNIIIEMDESEEMNSNSDEKLKEGKNEFKMEQSLIPDNAIFTTHKKIIEKIPYRRVSFITGKLKKDPKEEKNLFNISPDFIEIENILTEKADLVYDYADIVSIHATCSLFASLIPFAPIIIFVFSILSQNARLYVDINFHKRPQSNECEGIGLWLYIIEFIEIISIVFNGFMVYFYGNNMFIQRAYSTGFEFYLGSGELSLVIVVVSEHILIFLLFLLNFAIPDIPSWVKKEKENLLSYYQVSESKKEIRYDVLMNKAVQELENKYQKKIIEIEEELDEKNKKINQYKDILASLRNELIKKDSMIGQNNELINNLLNNAQKLQEKKGIDYPRIRHIIKDEKGIKDIAVGMQGVSNTSDLPDDIFMKVVKSSILINLKFDEILQKAANELITNNNKAVKESELYDDNQSILKTYFFFLLRNTFDSIEKCILSKKLSVILNNIKYPIVLCDLCLKERANFICNNCNELFCENCKNIHLSNEIWSKHEIETFKIPEIKNVNHNIIFKNNEEEEEEDENIFNYVKMEEFSFPTEMTQNLGYENLNLIFHTLYVEYINHNGILQNNIISAKKFIQFKMEFITKLETIPNQAILDEIEPLIMKSPFNLLELYLINRVCYKIFKFFGAKAQPSQLYKALKALQTSTFEERLKILLNILDIFDNQLILKSEIEKLLIFFSYQTYYDYLSINNILSSIYAGDIQFVQLAKLYESILKDKNLNKIFKYLLQYEDPDKE